MLIESAAGAAPCSLPASRLSRLPPPHLSPPSNLAPRSLHLPPHIVGRLPNHWAYLSWPPRHLHHDPALPPTPMHSSNTDPQPGMLGLMPMQQHSPPGVPRTHEKPLLPPSSSCPPASALQGRAGSSRERRQALEGGRIQAAQLIVAQVQVPASRRAVRGRVLWRVLPDDDGVWWRC